MLYSKSSQYALQAMIYIADHHRKNKLSLIAEIAEAKNIPRHFLSKLIQVLVKHRFVKSIRGRNGGIKLAKPASKITVEKIVHAIDGVPSDDEICVIGLEICNSESSCPLHDDWKLISNEIHATISNKSIDQLVIKELINKK